MYQTNPLINKFNAYKTHIQQSVPFQGNDLIGQNVHVKNNLEDSIQMHRLQKKSPSTKTESRGSLSSLKSGSSSQKKNTVGGKMSIIENMLKPQKIEKNNNSDVTSNYTIREKKQTNYVLKRYDNEPVSKDVAEEFVLSNAPYKSILKDKILTKAAKDIVKEDLEVHKVKKEIDANIEIFEKDHIKKNISLKEINDELDIEFHQDNYDTHKAKFEYKQSFIKTMVYENKNFNENKDDYLDFYRKEQKKIEDGIDLCDRISKMIDNQDLIDINELPTDSKTEIAI